MINAPYHPKKSLSGSEAGYHCCHLCNFPTLSYYAKIALPRPLHLDGSGEAVSGVGCFSPRWTASSAFHEQLGYLTGS